MSKRDYYDILEVERTTSDAQIVSAYRKLAIRYHPDSNPGDEEATRQFKEVAEAYEVLSDREKRARYDQFGHAGVQGPGGQGPGYSDVEDIFDAFGDIFGGAFGDMLGGGGGGRRRRGPRRGGRVDVEVLLDLEEAARGVKKTIEFDRHEHCRNCGGSGNKPGAHEELCQRCGGRGQVVQSAGILRVQTTCQTCRGKGRVITDPCRHCRGRGLMTKRVKLDVTIPAGVDSGMQVRLSGEGEPSPNGGPPGDCYCFISLRPHPLFQRDGADLHVRIPISYSQAALGAVMEIPTLEGPDEFEIPAGTQSGEVFRLARKGMPDPHGGRRGNLLVGVIVEVPTKLSSRQDELLRELAEEEQANVSPHRHGFLEKLREYIAPGKSD